MSFRYFYAKIKTWLLRSMQYAGIFSLSLSVYNTIMLKYISSNGHSTIFAFGLSLENITLLGIGFGVVCALLFGAVEFALVGPSEYDYSWSKTPMASKLCDQVDKLYKERFGEDHR